MKAGGVVLAVVGVWVLCQVLGGNALGRLHLIATGGELTGENGTIRKRQWTV